MLHILIADKENSIASLIFEIISEKKAEMEICYAARNVDEVLHAVDSYHPDLVLIDVAHFSPDELIQIQKTKETTTCRFIAASADSSAARMQLAIRLGVDAFLIKPVVSQELLETILSSAAKLDNEQFNQLSYKSYFQNRRSALLLDILANQKKFTHSEQEIYFPKSTEKLFQILLCEPFKGDGKEITKFSDHLKNLQKEQDYLCCDVENNRQIILLIGKAAHKAVHNFFQNHHEYEDRNTPYYTFFITCGRTVSSLDEVALSYEDAKQLIDHRYFMNEEVHVLTVESGFIQTGAFQLENVEEFCDQFCTYLQSYSRVKLQDMLLELQIKLSGCTNSIPEVKLFLSDIFLSIKQQMLKKYPDAHIRFPANYTILYLIEHSERLDDVLDFYNTQFESILNSIGDSTGNNIFYDIIYYVNHNFQDNIKLEGIAKLFGYNSSYLGKLFQKRVGENFNSYLDYVRISHAKILLTQGNMKIYEISERVGYKNVDYFYKKFRTVTGTTPADYRRNLL
ncbi:MAG: helix-turn-helix domain-containing protein [Lachnospiraceae bacterium]